MGDPTLQTSARLDALYDAHLSGLSARDKLRLLSRLAVDVAAGAVDAPASAGGSEPEGAPMLVVEDGLLVIAGPLHGPIPDHRELRAERLDRTAQV